MSTLPIRLPDPAVLKKDFWDDGVITHWAFNRKVVYYPYIDGEGHLGLGILNAAPTGLPCKVVSAQINFDALWGWEHIITFEINGLHYFTDAAYADSPRLDRDKFDSALAMQDQFHAEMRRAESHDIQGTPEETPEYSGPRATAVLDKWTHPGVRFLNVAGGFDVTSMLDLLRLFFPEQGVTQ